MERASLRLAFAIALGAAAVVYLPGRAEGG